MIPVRGSGTFTAGIIQSSSYRKSGGPGWITREIARSPADAPYPLNAEHPFDYRISIARVWSSGQWSDYTGFERHFVLLDGDGVQIKHDPGKKKTIRKLFLPYPFSGDLTTYGTLLGDQPIEDFNVMIRREFGYGRVNVIRPRIGAMSSSVSCELSAPLHFFFAARGSFEVYWSDTNQCIGLLEHQDTLRLNLNRRLGREKPGIQFNPLEEDSVILGVTIFIRGDGDLTANRRSRHRRRRAA